MNRGNDRSPCDVHRPRDGRHGDDVSSEREPATVPDGVNRGRALAAWVIPGDHRFHWPYHIGWAHGHIGMLARPHPEHFVDEALADLLYAPEVDDDITEAIQSGQQSARFGSADKPNSDGEQLDYRARTGEVMIDAVRGEDL